MSNQNWLSGRDQGRVGSKGRRKKMKGKQWKREENIHAAAQQQAIRRGRRYSHRDKRYEPVYHTSRWARDARAA